MECSVELVYFAPSTVGGQTLGQFVTKPFQSWVNETQKEIASEIYSLLLIGSLACHDYSFFENPRRNNRHHHANRSTEKNGGNQ